ncbi:MAG: translation elongation factor Ts, partial [Clostridia bacterium]|nr:translation elongation factor Ts [Clostridia bacterium]
VVAEQNPADVEALGNCALDGKTVNEAVQDLFLAVRENIKIRRFERFEGNVGSYVHGGGKIGVLVNFDTTAEVAATAEFKTLTKDIAMQIAAANPTFLDRDSVPAETIEHEKNIMISQMKEDPKMANKPEQVLAKIVEGKMGKYFSEVCLLEQTYVKDGDFTVGKYIESVAKKLGGDIKLVKYARLEKGEGLEKRSDNFADEVASMMK